MGTPTTTAIPGRPSSTDPSMVNMITRRHPLYNTFADTWRKLADVYEGGGGFLTGSYLYPHSRELEYVVINNSDGTKTIDYSQVKSETRRFTVRKSLARYENFAASILDTILDYLHTKTVQRTIPNDPDGLQDWWRDVDGERTDISDWMKAAQLQACIYGHDMVVMDRPALDAPPRSRADQPQPFLRLYTPLDMPDWIAGRARLKACKFVEAVERESLMQPPLDSIIAQTQFGAPGDGARRSVNYRLWDDQSWSLYNMAGELIDRGDHQMGETPVVILQGRPRAIFRVIGRSVLGHPNLYIDHYNLLSEKRQIERDQTFSILNIPLKDDQTTDDAQALAGNVVGTSNVLFTRVPAQFLAPPDGPIAHYERELASLENKIYRLIGLPAQSDTRMVESAEARRLKSTDLNRLLAGLADEAERVEYAIVRLRYIALYGPDEGQSRYEKSQVSIKYPDEFQTQEILDVIADLRAKLSVGLGPTANKLARTRVLPVVFPDLTDEQQTKIETEIADTPIDAVSAASKFRADILKVTGRGGAQEQPVGQQVPGRIPPGEAIPVKDEGNR